MGEMINALVNLVELWEKEMNINLTDADKMLFLTELNTEKKIVAFITYFKTLWEDNKVPTKNYEMANLICRIAREN